MYFSTQHSRVYLASACLGINCVNGMSTMFRRSQLDRLGGLSQFADYIAEDFFIGEVILMCAFLCYNDMMITKVLSRASLRPDISAIPTNQCPGDKSLRMFYHRQLRSVVLPYYVQLMFIVYRWARLRQHMLLLPSIVEPFVECFLCCAILAFTLSSWAGIPPAYLFVVLALAWLIDDYILTCLTSEVRYES